MSQHRPFRTNTLHNSVLAPGHIPPARAVVARATDKKHGENTRDPNTARGAAPVWVLRAFGGETTSVAQFGVVIHTGKQLWDLTHTTERVPWEQQTVIARVLENTEVSLVVACTPRDYGESSIRMFRSPELLKDEHDQFGVLEVVRGAAGVYSQIFTLDRLKQRKGEAARHEANVHALGEGCGFSNEFPVIRQGTDYLVRQLEEFSDIQIEKGVPLKFNAYRCLPLGVFHALWPKLSHDCTDLLQVDYGMAKRAQEVQNHETNRSGFDLVRSGSGKIKGFTLHPGMESPIPFLFPPVSEKEATHRPQMRQEQQRHRPPMQQRQGQQHRNGQQNQNGQQQRAKPQETQRPAGPGAPQQHPPRKKGDWQKRHPKRELQHQN